MSSNVDIYVANQMAAMYSENENEYMATTMEQMFTEVDEEG